MPPVLLSPGNAGDGSRARDEAEFVRRWMDPPFCRKPDTGNRRGVPIHEPDRVELQQLHRLEVGKWSQSQ